MPKPSVEGVSLGPGEEGSAALLQAESTGLSGWSTEIFGHLILIFHSQPEIILGMETVTPLDVNFLSKKFSAAL